MYSFYSIFILFFYLTKSTRRIWATVTQAHWRIVLTHLVAHEWLQHYFNFSFPRIGKECCFTNSFTNNKFKFHWLIVRIFRMIYIFSFQNISLLKHINISECKTIAKCENLDKKKRSFDSIDHNFVARRNGIAEFIFLLTFLQQKGSLIAFLSFLLGSIPAIPH